MAARAASDHLPNQEEKDEGEEDLNLSVLLPDHEDWKAAESAATSSNREYVEEKLQQHQEVVESSFSSLIIRPQPTGSDTEHSPSEIDDGSRYWQSPIQALDGAAGILKILLGEIPISPTTNTSESSIKISRQSISSLPMKKPEPSRSHSHHSKPVVPRSAGHRPSTPCAGKLAPKFSSLKRVKEELNPNVPRSCRDAPRISANKGYGKAASGTVCNKATDPGIISSSRTKDPTLRTCKICEEMKQENEMISVNKTCFHSFCSTCVSKHVKTRITDNHRVTVPCPGLNCKHSVEFESCLGIVPKDVLEAWDRAFCESLILDAHKFYCPFRDCSAMLVNDSEKVVEESECPHCHRLFCAQCRVPWHAGVSCEEFQVLSEDERGHEDLMLRQLVAEKKWGRCPNCKFFVERTQGCPHITCRCRYEFCYGCGTQWGIGHEGCCRN